MLFIEIDGKVDWLGRCVAADAIAFSLLRNHLLSLQSQYDDPTDGIKDRAIRYAIEQMYRRMPSILGEKLLSDSQLWEYEDLMIDLFWGPEAAALQEVSPPPVEAKPEKEEFELEPPTSGDAFADLFAQLIAVDNTVDGAIRLLNGYSLDTLINLTRQLSELRKPHQERLNEAKAKRFDEIFTEAKKSDPALYHQILGLDEAKPL